MKVIAGFAVLLAMGVSGVACRQRSNKARTADKPAAENFVVAAEKPFVAGGSISIQLDGGSYEIAPTSANQIRVTLSGTIGRAKVDLDTKEAVADLVIKDTQNHFQALIEVPAASNLAVRLSGGNLVVGPIVGNKDIKSYAGNTEVVVGNPDEYSSVDASVKAGDITAGAFGGSRSGLFQHFAWSGPGMYTLRADLGAGNLDLHAK